MEYSVIHAYDNGISWHRTSMQSSRRRYLEETGDPMVDEALDGRPWGKGSSGKEMVSTDKSSPCNVTEDTDDNVDISHECHS